MEEKEAREKGSSFYAAPVKAGGGSRATTATRLRPKIEEVRGPPEDIL